MVLTVAARLFVTYFVAGYADSWCWCCPEQSSGIWAPWLLNAVELVPAEQAAGAMAD